MFFGTEASHLSFFEKAKYLAFSGTEGLLNLIIVSDSEEL